jgi:hypothetical protein
MSAFVLNYCTFQVLGVVGHVNDGSMESYSGVSYVGFIVVDGFLRVFEMYIARCPR